MGRPIKNPTHPLAKLRNVLSTPGHQVTRKELAKRAGIPETSLRDIENGKYKMTPEVAEQISHAIGSLSPQSLLAGDDPLMDLWGKPFTRDSPSWPEELWRSEDQEVRQQLFSAAWAVACEKKRSRLVAFNFETWLLKTFQAYGLDQLLIEKLTDRLVLFDPSLVPREFWPKNKQLAKKWESFNEQIQEESVRVAHQDGINDPEYFDRPENSEPWETLIKTESGRAIIRDSVLRSKALRAEARWRVAQRWQEETTKASTPKPLSGKRPRSGGRPAA
jgi:DNA-binding XRE family transcriptional regulator